MDLKQIVTKGVHNLNENNKKASKSEANGILRGSNTPLYIEGNFISSEADHCPRKAIFRSKYGIVEEKNASSLISHKAGRVVEEIVKDFIDASGENGLSYVCEEETQIVVKDTEGQTIYTARPDIVFTHHNSRYAFELKSIQSSSSYIQTVIEKIPKCGALLQIAAQHALLNIENGFIAYVLYYYLDGYNMSTKSKIKSPPIMEIFNTRMDNNGIIHVNNKRTIISKERIENSIMVLHEYLKQDMIPDRPQFMTVFGRPAKYSPCNYCFLKDTCNTIDTNRMKYFKDFINGNK